LEVKAAGA